MSAPSTAPPIDSPTVVEGDLFFCQGGGQLNGGRDTVGTQPTGDFQPVLSTFSFCTIVVHRRLGTDQCDGGAPGCNHSTPSTLTHFHVGTSSDASTPRNHTMVTTLFHKDILHRKRGLSIHSTTLRLAQCQVLQMTIPWNPIM